MIHNENNHRFAVRDHFTCRIIGGGPFAFKLAKSHFVKPPLEAYEKYFRQGWVQM